jgi:methionyl-tRNA formyltransferase
MRIVYIGTVEFSRYCLNEVLKNQGNVVGIVTSKNNMVNSDYHDLTPVANTNNIPIHYCTNVNDSETVQWIKDRKPDIIFCWGWSKIIGTELLSLPPMGIVGAHPSLLPYNRGRHPLIWSLVLGLTEGGLTFFFMDKGADSGPILSRRGFEITTEDTAMSLYTKIEQLAESQIAEFLPQLISGTYSTTIQNTDKANYLRKRTGKDGIIDWRMGKEAILNLIRALTKPYPGATFDYKGQTVTVWEAYTYQEQVSSNMEPGKIILPCPPVIKCYDGAIQLDNYEPHIDFITGDYL